MADEIAGATPAERGFFGRAGDFVRRNAAGAGSWAEEAASDAWSATSGALRVVGQPLRGAANRVLNHPLETASEVAVGLGVATGAAMSGIGVVGGAAIAAIPAAIYVGRIALTDGVQAVPGRVAQDYRDVRANLSALGDDITTVYRGGSQSRAAEERLQRVGEGAVPLAAGLIGGSGTRLGRELLGVAGRTAEDIARTTLMPTLPGLSLAPALAAGSERALAAAPLAASRRAPSWEQAGAGGAGASVMRRDGAESGHPSAPTERVVGENRRAFIDGEVPRPLPAGIERRVDQDVQDALREHFRRNRSNNGTSAEATPGPDGLRVTPDGDDFSFELTQRSGIRIRGIYHAESNRVQFESGTHGTRDFEMIWQ